MLIRSSDPATPSEAEVTPEALWLRRREFLRGAAFAAGGVAATSWLGACGAGESEAAPGPDTLPGGGRWDTDEAQTPFEDATSYNNFYEFGTDKKGPKRFAQRLELEPWSVAIEGEVARPGVVALEDLLAPHSPEDRIYRMRCVEAWSMVIPWRGIPLGDILRRFEPTSKAKYVAFETLLRPEQMLGQKRPILDWPYREGLRMEEAMHPLTLMAVGMYGVTMPKQNGAPLRLVVPWKYGFKGIKSIVRIRLQETRPETTWNVSAPEEYGFFANVNPAVDHPRWTQKRERRIGEFRKRDTLPFNGYAEHVASLYAGMDLTRQF